MAAIVALVTPADQNSPSVQAFIDEGNRLVWPNSATVQLYSPANAQKAHDDVQSAGGVLVAGGEKTAFALQQITPTTDKIAIIVPYAGEVPSNHASNMTGFIGDCGTVAQNHLRGLKGRGHDGKDVTVLFDSDQTNTATQDILGKLLQIDANINQMGIALTSIQGLAGTLLTTGGFMLIPNAVFFEYAGVITGVVDDSNQVATAYYPEFEYWRHQTKKVKPTSPVTMFR